MRTLITGGTGFIGSRLALDLLGRGDEVRLFGQVNTPAEKANLELVQSAGGEVLLGSVVERSKVQEAVQGREVIYHLAAAQHEANIPDQRFWEVNVEGTRHMLEAGVENRVRRFVHGSTIGVYGSLDGRIDERSACRPENIYGITKLEGEKLALSFGDRLPVAVVRISETYGPGDRRLLKLFKSIKKRMFFVIGNGKNLHHPIFIDDLIEGLRLAATSEKAVGEVCVLAGKEAVSTTEMARTIAAQLGSRLPAVRAPLSLFLAAAVVLETGLRPLGIQPPLHRRRMDFFRKSFEFSGDKAAAVLGFQPQTAFEQGIAETARWYAEMGYL